MKANVSYLFFGTMLVSCAVLASAHQKSATKPVVATIEADANTPPILPNSNEPYTLDYKVIHSEAVEDLARLIRSYTRPTSRIIPIEKDARLYVTDSAISLKRAYEIIKANDVKPTFEMRKQWQEIEKTLDKKNPSH